MERAQRTDLMVLANISAEVKWGEETMMLTRMRCYETPTIEGAVEQSKRNKH